MTFFDFILFFIYVFIFNLLFARSRKKLTDPVLKKYHRYGFWVKVVGAFAYSMFVLYISPGDTTGLYYPEGYNIYKLILHDSSNAYLLIIPGKEFDQTLLANPYNLGYFYEEANYMISRIVAILCFVTYGKFMAINLIFSLFSFTGVWKLYRFFYDQYPSLHKQFAIALIFFPTFVFWSSGILKDPLCTGALGWITYCLYHVVYLQKNVLRNTVLLIFFSVLLIILKVYIIVSYLPFFILFLLLKNVNLIKSKFIKAFLLIIVITGGVFGFIKVSKNIDSTLGGFTNAGISKSIIYYQKSYAAQAENAGSNFSLGVEYDGSLSSLARMAPAAVIATLFRPFLWESKKISTLLSSLESLALILFTLYVIIKVKPLKMISIIINNPLAMYCFFYSILFALFVGATTLNFGTLVRYKIPGMPFYLIALFIMLYQNKQNKKPAGKSGPVLVSEM
ncbi:MAG: hypothetical protein ABIY51_09795 [Ferruginibacter sp.]